MTDLLLFVLGLACGQLIRVLYRRVVPPPIPRHYIYETHRYGPTEVKTFTVVDDEMPTSPTRLHYN